MLETTHKRVSRNSYLTNWRMLYNVIGVVVILNMIKMSTSPIVPDKMKEKKVVPEIIPVPPIDFLRVVYRAGGQVNLGEELTPYQVRDQPIVRWMANPDLFYTLCMIDGDSPCLFNSELREWLHWLVGNIPGEMISMGDTLAGYIGALPQNNTGIHRYVLLVYEQPEKLIFDEIRLDDKTVLGRSGFSIKKFVQKYNLSDPLAGNFFTSQYDEYVPTMYEKLGMVPVTDEE